MLVEIVLWSMNNVKSVIKPINSSKNKLNNKIIYNFILHPKHAKSTYE